ncbi:MAG: hypothetical protein IMW95_10445 [Moorella humiferrea]|nr:hypothetical protein [Moorella humiferrea]
MVKKPKNVPAPKITKVKVTGKLDSLTDLLKLRLFEYSPQAVDELVKEAQQNLLVNHTLAKIQKNVNRCLSKNPCFRSEGKGLWCLRLDGLKENDAAHRVLQSQGDAMRLTEINAVLKEAGKPEVPGEQKLVADGRFIRLKDGRWGLIHWSYVEPESVPSPAGEKTPSQPAVTSPIEAGKKEVAAVMAPQTSDTVPLAQPEPAAKEDFWDKLFPLKPTGEKGTAAPTTPVKQLEPEPPAWAEIAAGAEAATLTLSLINGGKAGTVRQASPKDEEKEKMRQEIEDLRRENKNLLGDLEKLHRRKEELRQELTQMEEQLVNLRVERDTLKKRVSHLETRLMQLQGTLNKTVSDAQAEQARLKQQLREQEYRLQTTLIANEDLERAVADLQKERQELKRQLNFWPVRLALRLAAFFGFSLVRERARARAYSR